jgi:hypothetical protein
MTLILRVHDRVDIAESIYRVVTLNGPDAPKAPVVLKLEKAHPSYQEWAESQFQHLSAKTRKEALDRVLVASISVSMDWMAERNARVLPGLEMAT